MKEMDTALAIACLSQGGILAYPTETCFGLGCDPFDTAALKRLVELKARNTGKGLIVLIAGMHQLEQLSPPLSTEDHKVLQSYWPGPTTFVLPALQTLPTLLTGNRDTVAVRWSSHPVAQQLCQNQPIVSTSANTSGESPIYQATELKLKFPLGLDGIINQACGGQPPSRIIDLRSGRRLR